MNYKETNITGIKWRRCSGINIQNPLQPQTPYITFTEDDVINLDGHQMIVGSNNLMTSFDPTNTVDIIDPDTLEPTGGTISDGEIYVLLFSKYMAEAKKQESSVVAPVNTTAGTPQHQQT